MIYTCEKDTSTCADICNYHLIVSGNLLYHLWSFGAIVIYVILPELQLRVLDVDSTTLSS